MADGYFPVWRRKNAGVVAPNERLSWPHTLARGAQHVVAMFGATVLAPLLMGFDPNVAILTSGVGTLLFFVITGGRVPSCLGSSFAFIGVVIGATAYAGQGPNANIAVAVGGIVACGAVYTLIGAAVMAGGFSPKFGSLIATTPGPVLADVSIVVFGLIAIAGARIWVQNHFTHARAVTDRRQ